MDETDQKHEMTRSLAFICEGKLIEACAVVAEYERRQSVWRGYNYDWGTPPSQETVSRLRAILNARPALLRDVREEDWAHLQKAAAMQDLWDERSAKAWLPDGFIGASNLDPITAARMVLFAGVHHANTVQYRECGAAHVRITECDELSCSACRQISRKCYRIEEAPEMPYSKCTSEMGCRCMALPDFD